MSNAKNPDPLDRKKAKTALFIRGTKINETVNTALIDLYSLKKPDAVLFQKRNTIHPFDSGTNEVSLEFFSQKNDASLMLIGTHSKKRPNNLTFVRMFDHHLLDVVEVSITDFLSIASIKGNTCAVGTKPSFVFNGEVWEQHPEYKGFQNVLLDFFRGSIVEGVNLSGLESLISVTADQGKIYFRVFRVLLKNSGTKLPHVELELMGPSMNLEMGRTRFASDELMKLATKVPKELRPKKVKNMATSSLGDKLGRVHMADQKLDQIQTRKVKALKKPRLTPKQ